MSSKLLIFTNYALGHYCCEPVFCGAFTRFALCRIPGCRRGRRVRQGQEVRPSAWSGHSPYAMPFRSALSHCSRSVGPTVNQVVAQVCCCMRGIYWHRHRFGFFGAHDATVGGALARQLSSRAAD